MLLDYGLEGYGLYWYCIELIVGKIDVDNITFELEHDARIIAKNTGSTAQKVEEMMRYFISQGLFESGMNGSITCLKLAKRLDKSMTSNPVMRDLIEKIRSKKPDGVMMNHDEVMQDKIRLDIDKNKDLAVSGESADDFLESEFSRFWRNYPTKKAKTTAKAAFKKFLKGKRESQVRMWTDLILNYHLDCIEREEVGADKLYPATLINQKRWEDNPEFMETFKRDWIAENSK